MNWMNMGTRGFPWGGGQGGGGTPSPTPGQGSGTGQGFGFGRGLGLAGFGQMLTPERMQRLRDLFAGFAPELQGRINDFKTQIDGFRTQMGDWRTQMGTWQDARPTHQGGLGDPAARQAFHTSMQNWIGSRPEIPDIPRPQFDRMPGDPGRGMVRRIAMALGGPPSA